MLSIIGGGNVKWGSSIPWIGWLDVWGVPIYGSTHTISCCGHLLVACSRVAAVLACVLSPDRKDMCPTVVSVDTSGFATMNGSRSGWA